MSQVMLEDAASQRDHWTEQANRGEEVIITRGTIPVAQIISADGAFNAYGIMRLW